MPQRLLHAFSPARLPPMTRASYRRELVSSLTMPAAVVLVEAGVVGVVAKKLFDVSPLQLAILSAAPMFANLTSFFWARLAHGHRKVPIITAVMASALVAIGSIALLPLTPAGAWLLTGLVVVTRCLLAGVVTLRSIVWRQNYPRHLRGRITARLAMLVSVVLLVTPLIGALSLDAKPESFRVLYGAGVLLALAGVFNFSRIRVRGERVLLGLERQTGRPISEAEGLEPALRLDRRPGAWRILRQDPLFRRYMLWQFIAGVSNMMLEPVVIDLVTDRAESMRGAFLVSIGLTQALPALMMIATLPWWARLLDRVHIARFRVAQAWLWVVSQLLLWVGAWWTGSLLWALLLIGLGRVVLGISRGGGVLAWNLGHNDFARRELVAVYMGIHVTLTGVRGAFAPFVGIALYTGWPALDVLGVSIPEFAGLGAHVFALAAALSLVATLGFVHLARQVGRRPPGSGGGPRPGR